MPVATASQPKQKPWEQRLDDYVYRNRAWITPPVVCGVLVGVAALGYAMRWSLWLAIGASVVFVLGLDAVSDLPSRDDDRWWRRHEEHLFGTAAWAVMCGWTGAAGYLGVTLRAVLILGGLALPLSVLWWTHRRVRRSVAVDKELRAWGDGTAVGLPGTRVRGKDAGAGWFSYILRADEHGRYTLESYKRARGRLAAKHRVKADAITITDGGHEGEAIVTVRQEERKTLGFQVTAEPANIMGTHTIGKTDDGSPMQIALQIPGRGAQHSAATGTSGSGKSGFANLIISLLVRAEFGLPWLFDFSPGAQEFRAWAPAAYVFVSNPEDADRAFTAAAAICEYRGKTSKTRLLVPSANRLHCGLVIDEAATLFAPQLLAADAPGMDRVKSMRVAANRSQQHEANARLFRKYAFSEHVSTQYGDAPALGGAPARDQLIGNGFAVGFGAPKDLTGHLIIPAGHGLQVSKIPRSKPGACGMLGPLADGLTMGRTEYMTDTDIDGIVAEWADRQRDLTRGEIDAADRATDGWFSQRPRTAPREHDDENPALDGDGNPAPVFAGTGSRRAVTQQESQQGALTALGSFPGPAMVSEVAEKWGRSSTLTRARLNELVDMGAAQRTGHNRWTKYQAVWISVPKSQVDDPGTHQ